MSWRYFMGVDLAQSRDYTAFAILEQIEQPVPMVGKERIFVERYEIVYHLRYLHRPPQGTKYPEIVRMTKQILEDPKMSGKTALVVDATGVGRPVVDLMKDAGLIPVSVTITAGTQAVSGKDGYHIPKRDLVSALQVLLHTRRLKTGNTPESKALVEELETFKVKTSTAGKDRFEAWRNTEHDDLVLATALAAWFAQRYEVKAGFTGQDPSKEWDPLRWGLEETGRRDDE